MEAMFPRRMSPRLATLIENGTNQLFTELATKHVTNFRPYIELVDRIQDTDLLRGLLGPRDAIVRIRRIFFRTREARYSKVRQKLSAEERE